MAKTLQFRDGSEDGPTGKFLLAVTHEAHRRLAPDQAEGVVAEVRDHLGAQVEMQVMNGMARTAAEREAVQGFGSARQFVRGVSHSLHDTRKAETARTATLTLTAVALAGMFFFQSRFGPSEWAGRHVPLYLLPVVGLAVVAGSWIGWRALPRQYALLGAGFVMALTLWAGFDTVTLPTRPDSRAPWLSTFSQNYSRSYMRRAEEAATIRRDMAAADVTQLTAGLEAFGINPSVRIQVRNVLVRTPDGNTVQVNGFDSALSSAMERQLTAQRERLQALRRLNQTELQAIAKRDPRLAQSLLLAQQARDGKLAAQVQRLRLEQKLMHMMAGATYNQNVTKLEASSAIRPFRISHGHRAEYLVPRTHIPYQVSENAFVSIPPTYVGRSSYQSAASYVRSYQQAVQQAAPVQKPTFEQARARWRTEGRRWLNTRKEELGNQERALDTIRRVEAAPFGFNVVAALHTLISPLLLLPLALTLLNVIPAFLARQTRRLWDGWVWRIRSAA